MNDDMDEIKRRAWFIIKLLLWYFFYQLVCTFGFGLLDDVASLVTGSDIYFGENATLAASLFLSALLMIWHLVTFGYVRFSPRFFGEVSPGVLVRTAVLIFGSMYVFNVTLDWLPLPDFMEDTFMDMGNEPLGVLSMALVAPLVEEMMFRGAIQGYLMRRCSNPWTAIVVSALVFGVIHMNPVQVVYATLLGLVLGWIYYRTRSLLPVIAGHVLNNSVAVASMKIWGSEDIEAITVDDKTVMLPVLLFIVALLVPVVLKLNRELPSVPRPWRGKDEE